MKVSTQQNLDTATCPIKCLKKLLLWTHHVFTSVSYSRNTKFSQATIIVTPESSEKQLPLILIFQAFDFTPTTMSSARSMRSRSKVSFECSFRQLPATQLRMRNWTSAFTLIQHNRLDAQEWFYEVCTNFLMIFYCL